VAHRISGSPGSRRRSGDSSSPAAFAEELCENAFGKYVGADLESSELGMAYLNPEQASWSDDDRAISCMVESGVAGQLLTGTARDSRR